MNAVELLENIQQLSAEQIQKGGVIWCAAPAYQPLFVTYLLNVIKRKNVYLQRLTTDSIDIAEFQRTVSFSFLGQTSFFWLSDLDSLDTKMRTAVIAFAQQYTGPHWFGFFSSSKVSPKSRSNILFAQVHPLVTYQECIQLWNLLWENVPNWATEIISKFFYHRKTLPLDTACLLLRYATILQKGSFEYFDQWSSFLIQEEQSFFILSGYLFSKNVTEFFRMWRICLPLYSEQFWTAFWSEQFFKAYWFNYYQYNGQPLLAQKIGTRLPFSFLKKDYKLFSLLELQAAHNCIFEIDWNMKNGYSLGFDSFFLNFMFGLKNDKDQVIDRLV